jgi:2,4-dienoyl-CoA reductase (NADPH2)
MASHTQFKNLLSPLKIRHLQLKNRIVKAPQGTRYANENCFIDERLKGHYEAIAAGGVGMIVLGALAWDPPLPGVTQIGIWDDKFIPGLKELAGVIHKHGCPVIGQLFHPGPATPQDITGGPPLSASALEKEELPSPSPYLNPPRGLTLQEIEDMEERFVKAAERAKSAGLDGVEIHAAHTYLLASFLSLIWNKRQDAYGRQDPRSRARIVVELIRKIKERLGADYILGVRINGEEWGAKRCITLAESQEIAKIVEEAGADYISVTGYGHGNPPFQYVPDYWTYPEPDEHMKPFIKRFRHQGLLITGADSIKKVVSLPVIGVGRLTPELAEDILREGKVDLVAFGRALYADPELPNKVSSGRLEEINSCTRCATCEDPIAAPRRCQINAALGKERELAIKPAEKKKNVMVVGGGPAGMEVARVAALRGHQVSLYEKTSKLGGLLPLATMVKGVEFDNILNIVRYLENQMSNLNINVNLKTEVDPQLVKEVKPDVVVIASGGIPNVPALSGINRSNVLGSSSLYRRVKIPMKLFGPRILRWLTKHYLPVGQKVIVMGGLIQGCQAAVFMVKRGRQVTIVETSEQLGAGIPPRYLNRLIPWFARKGVTTLTGVKYEEITEKGLTLVTKDGKKQTLEADTIMVTTPLKPNTDLFQALEGKVPEIYMIGACNGEQSGLIVHAIADGRRIGCTI